MPGLDCSARWRCSSALDMQAITCLLFKQVIACIYQKNDRRKLMPKSTFVYVTYIRTTPEKLWSALTDDVEFMKQYWFGNHCESEWTAGSSWKMVQSEGQISDSGEIVAAEPPRRLAVRWK